jgi:PKD repeat protein
MHLSRIAGLKRFVLLLVMTATWSAGTLTLTACSDDADSSVGSIQASIVQATPLRGHAPLEVSFEAVSDDATTDISATWDFGDGSTRTGPATVRYTYQDAGTFEAKVTLTDAEDRAGTDSRLVEVRPTTDLIVSSLQAQPLDLRTGEQLNLQFNLRNDAAQVEFPFNLIVFLTNNRTARYDDQADFVILHSETRETFAGKGEEGDSEDFTLSLGLPVGLPTGSYFLGVMVDPARAIGEIDDNNNILVLEQQVNIENPLTNGPDLVASQIAINPKTTRILSSLSLTTTFRNQGLRSAANFSYAAFLSRDNVFDEAEDLFLLEKSIAGLSTGATFVDAALAPVNPVVTEPGDYYVFVIIDPRGEVLESDETNNLLISANPITITDDPITDADIIVTGFDAEPTNTFVGGSFLATVTVVNQGTEATGSFVCAVYLSEDQSLDIDQDTPIGSINVFSLAGGAEEVFERPVSIPPSISPGSYSSFVFCDSSGVVVEFDENNNAQRFLAPITVQTTSEVDLRIEAVALNPVSPIPTDTPAVLSFDVCNSGSTGASPNVLRVYLSGDNIADPGDVQLFETLIPGIEPSACQTFEVNLDVACQPWKRDYQLLVQADVRNIVRETNENNNTGALSGGLNITGDRCVCLNDAREPNNFSSLAIGLTEGSNDGLALCAGDTDWFKIPLQAGDSIQVDLLYDPSFGQLDITLYDPSRGKLEEARATSEQSRVDAYMVPTGGDYLVQILRSTQDAQNYYDLDINVLQPAVGTPDLAAVDILVSNYAPPINQPIFVSGAVVNLSNTAVNQRFITSLYLSSDRILDAQDTELFSFPLDAIAAMTRVPFGESVTLPGDVPSGRWFILAKADTLGAITADASPANNLGASSPLTLNTSCFDSFEPNDTLANAAVIIPQTVDPAPSPSYTGLAVCKTNTDFYRFTARSGQQVRVTLSSDVTRGDADIVLRTPQGAEIAASRTTNNIEEVLLPVIIGDQDIYIEVIQLSSNFNSERSDYDLTVTMVDAPASLVCNADFEPNNRFEDAQSLLTAAALPTSIATCPNTDEDFYKVYLTAGTSIGVTFDTQSANLRATLYNPARQFVQTLFDLRTGNLNFTAPTTGDYFIKVFAGAGAPREIEYGINVSALSGYDLVVTDFTALPTTQAAGESLLYALDIINQGTQTSLAYDVTFTLATDIAFTDIVATFTDTPRQAALGAQLRNTLSGKIDLPPTLASGPHFLRADLTAVPGLMDLNELNNASTLDLDVLAVCLPDASEGANDNNIAARATLITTLPTSVDASICASDEDWFSINLANGEAITVDATFTHNLGDLDLFLYDDSLTQVGSSRSVSDNESIAFTAPAAGDYFIRVKAFSGATTNTYTLDVQ